MGGRDYQKIERRTSNVQLPTSNIDGAKLYLLNQTSTRLQNFSLPRAVRPGANSRRTRPIRILKGKIALRSPFNKMTEYIIRYWTFDVGCSLVSFSIKLAGFLAGGWPDTGNLKK
jgi:hypothetical protein